MTDKMLIDAAHSEETRVVVTRGNRVEEFDFEALNRKQLRGNIYLAKVTRVEPSLQAAFVEYGGNRQGFLAFSEIHPDYYQIPVADRLALLEDDARARAQDDEDDEGRAQSRNGGRRDRKDGQDRKDGHGQRGQGRGRRRVMGRRNPSEVVSGELETGGDIDLAMRSDVSGDEGTQHAEFSNEGANAESSAHNVFNDEDHQSTHHDNSVEHNELAPALDDLEQDDQNDVSNQEGDSQEADSIEQVGNEDALEEVPDRPRVARRQYKIQEVIKRRQIILVQVVKEERGNKGAALTTYLSLAGRYSVLMPNTARGGGISRKITNSQDRKHLKEIAQELEVPEGMGVILRTAGATRTKPEIKRDFEYLLRLWESVRELTLQSSAPSLVYEEGSLIKRSIRDLYNKEIDEIIVAGDAAYREAKDFMRMLMPSQSKIVKLYKEPHPLFIRHGVETQLDAMFVNQITLKSGGYLVLNQTEALVAIDVNSGRSTREHNIEDTALKTNLEAAEEVARQLRLRDLAGLVVIDFIDMEENRNNRLVEKRLKECLKNDRAKIQIGRISPFGLLEMSRQRLRSGVFESSTVACEHCAGAGFQRSTSSIALHILRNLEDALIKSSTHHITIYTRAEVALYLLNQKRASIMRLENLFEISITIQINPALMGTTYYTLERGMLAPPKREGFLQALTADTVEDDHDSDDHVDDVLDENNEGNQSDSATASNDESPSARAQRDENEQKRRRRRRRGRGGRDREERDGQPRVHAAQSPETSVDEGSSHHDGETSGEVGSTDQKTADQKERGNASEVRDAKGRRRGRRGGRNRFERGTAEGQSTEDQNNVGADQSSEQEQSSEYANTTEQEPSQMPVSDGGENVESAPEKRRFRSRATPLAPDVAQALDAVPQAVTKSQPRVSKATIIRGKAGQEKSEPDHIASALAGKPVVVSEPVIEQATEPVAIVLTPPTEGPKRSGWWAKAKAAMTGNQS